MEDSEYQLAYYTDRVGQLGRLKMKILIDIPRELSEEEKFNMDAPATQIIKSILKESIRLSPKLQEEAKEEERNIKSLFDGYVVYTEKIPNGYCNDYCCEHLPWFIFTTPKGRIKIGWRKHVINIDWSDSDIKYKAEHLFPSEQVTKSEKYIHADGYEKAKEYINLLMNI